MWHGERRRCCPIEQACSRRWQEGQSKAPKAVCLHGMQRPAQTHPSFGAFHPLSAPASLLACSAPKQPSQQPAPATMSGAGKQAAQQAAKIGGRDKPSVYGIIALTAATWATGRGRVGCPAAAAAAAADSCLGCRLPPSSPFSSRLPTCRLLDLPVPTNRRAISMGVWWKRKASHQVGAVPAAVAGGGTPKRQALGGHPGYCRAAAPVPCCASRSDDTKLWIPTHPKPLFKPGC